MGIIDPSNGNGMSTRTSGSKINVIRTAASLAGIAIFAGALGYYIMANPSRPGSAVGDIDKGQRLSEQVHSQPKSSPLNIISQADEAVKSSPLTVSSFSQRSAPDYKEREIYARELMTRLMELAKLKENFHDEQIREVNRILVELGQKGAAALPAIDEFLESMQDIDFADRPNPKAADYVTLRAGLIDTLDQIGGAEAVNIMART